MAAAQRVILRRVERFRAVLVGDMGSSVRGSESGTPVGPVQERRDELGSYRRMECRARRERGIRWEPDVETGWCDPESGTVLCEPESVTAWCEPLSVTARCEP